MINRNLLGNLNILSAYSRWLVMLVVVGLSVGCASNNFIIKTEKPEKNFVVLCEWWAGPIFHGGKKLERQKVFISESNKVGNCGGFLYGDLDMTVLHPLYKGVGSCGHPQPCKLDKNGVMVITPEPFGETLANLPERLKFKSREYLYDSVRNVTRGHFDIYYYKKYVKASKPDIEEFKALYHDELIEYIRLANTLRDPEKQQLDPEGYMKRYWERVENYLKE